MARRSGDRATIADWKSWSREERAIAGGRNGVGLRWLEHTAGVRKVGGLGSSIAHHFSQIARDQHGHGLSSPTRSGQPASTNQ